MGESNVDTGLQTPSRKRLGNVETGFAISYHRYSQAESQNISTSY